MRLNLWFHGQNKVMQAKALKVLRSRSAREHRVQGVRGELVLVKPQRE